MFYEFLESTSHFFININACIRGTENMSFRPEITYWKLPRRQPTVVDELRIIIELHHDLLQQVIICI